MESGIRIWSQDGWTFNGMELSFAIGSWTNDNWQVGFCRPGELERWRSSK